MVRNTALIGVIFALAAGLLGGCAREVQRVVVRGGPSLDALFADLADEYGKQHPEVELVTNFSCPPCVLFQRDGQRAPLDVFVSIGRFEMDRLVEAGKIAVARTIPVGQTGLALVTSAAKSEQVQSLADLHTADIEKIGVGDPSRVAVGHYAKEALVKAGMWKELESRLVYSQSGCELLKWLALGRDIDAAIVFGVCPTSDGVGSVRSVQEFPPDVIPPVPVFLAVTRDAQNPDAANSFVDFVAGPEARAILAKHNVDAIANND